MDVEVRSGGPAIGFQSVPTQMYTDKDILLGWVNTDEAIQNSKDRPTTAVFATFEKAPWMIMWDPATYPNAKTIADLGKTDAVVRYFDGATYMDYLTGAGRLKKDQTDGSYDGTPANFIAAGGKDAQQGFATDEIYVYENELEDWKKPVAYQLVADTGYPLYAVALATRTGDLAANSPCLKKLIPVVQKATADYFASPEAVNALIVETVKKFDTGWVYSAGLAADSVVKQRELGLVSNGDDKTLGDFDEARVQQILTITTPIFEKNGTRPRTASRRPTCSPTSSSTRRSACGNHVNKLDFHGVGLTFEGGATALEGVDLTIDRGEFVSVVGPSGCGKSTLLRIASGLTTATSGTVDVSADRIGYVFQDATLLPWRTVQRNVELLPRALRTGPAAPSGGCPRGDRHGGLDRLRALPAPPALRRHADAGLAGPVADDGAGPVPVRRAVRRAGRDHPGAAQRRGAGDVRRPALRRALRHPLGLRGGVPLHPGGGHVARPGEDRRRVRRARSGCGATRSCGSGPSSPS